MIAPVIVRNSSSFTDRAEALAHFFRSAGEAPRLLAYDEEMGCPLHNALAALEWAGAVGVLAEGDLLHAARLGGETAAVVLERRSDDQRVFVYIGPRVDSAPPHSPYEGSILYDEPGVKALEFVQRAHALAHFLRATQGVGGLVSLLSRRAPEVTHIRRWLGALFQEPFSASANLLMATWFATTGAGFLFAPVEQGAPWLFEEVSTEE